MEKTESKANRLSFTILFTVLVVLAYGICIPKLSFYGDDWIYIYNYHIAGPEGFTLFTKWDRPFSAWVYILASAVFGENVLCYHLLLLSQRWLAVFLFWKILSLIWGENTCTQTSVLLFALYPGFLQQPISVQYIMHFASLDLVLFSISALLRSVHGKHSLLWQSVGILSAAVSIFTCEYFVGLELMRPLFLYFYIVRQQSSEPFKNTFRKYAPYLIVLAAFLYWRIFIFSFRTYQAKFIEQFSEAPASAIRTLIKTIFHDFSIVLYKAYRNTLHRSVLLASRNVLMIAVVTFILCALFFFFRKNSREIRASGSAQMMLCAVYGLFAAGIPFWVTYIDVLDTFPWDRSTLSFSPAAAMLIASLLSLVFSPVIVRVLAAGICACSAAMLFQNAQVYIHEAGKMNDYFWQLAQRIPALEKGTILVSDEIPLNRYSDGDLTPVVNWQYAPEVTGYHIPYKYFDLDLREGTYYSDPSVIVPVDHTYRCQMFSSTTGKTLGIFYREGGCLQIIDETMKDYPGLPESLQHIAKLSDPSLIRFDSESSAVPPKAIGLEKKANFCYDYQGINRSLQLSDLQAANDYTNDILLNGYAPQFAADWAPVLITLFLNGNAAEAENIIHTNSFTGEEQNYICGRLSQYDSEFSPDSAAITAAFCGK